MLNISYLFFKIFVVNYFIITSIYSETRRDYLMLLRLIAKTCIEKRT